MRPRELHRPRGSLGHLTLDPGPILAMMPATPAPVRLSFRPRRIAFLVDAAHERRDEVLDAILDFNVSSWGGRHNPILLVESGSLSPAYFPVLDAADPDIICAFGDLQPDLIAQLVRRYRPLDILSHGTYVLDRVSVSLWGDQVSVQQLLNSLSAPPKGFFRYIDPMLLEVPLPEEQNVSRFFRWNFGYTHLNHFAIRNHAVKPLATTVISDTSLVAEVCSHPNVALNISICGDAPLAMQIGHEWLPAFTLFVGDTAETQLAYWNDALAVGRISSLSIQRSLWLTTANVNDTELMEAISRLPAFMSGSSGYNSVLRVVSCDKTEDELREIAHVVRERTHLAVRVQVVSHVSASPWFPPPQPASRALRADVPDFEYAHGHTLHLPLHLPAPIDVERDERLMVNLRIDEPEQELYYSNVSPWWMMPKHEGLNAAFRRLPCRIDTHQELAAEIHSNHRHLDVELPQPLHLFQALFSPERQRRSSHDLRPPLTGQYRLRLSDKGQYASGTLALAPTLQDALRLFENPFWRTILTRLARPQIPPLSIDRLQATIRRSQNSGTPMDDAAWITDILADVAAALPSIKPLTFAELEREHASYVASIDDEHNRRSAQRTDLRADLEELVERRIIVQGTRIRCPNCGGKFWYGMHLIDRTVTCQGCVSAFAFPAEATWFYQLNELVRRGVSDFGLVPIFRTLSRIFHESREDFFFLPGVELVEYVNDELRSAFESDIVWIKDGEFGIAEVKSNTGRFRPADRDRLRQLYAIALPDVIVLAAPEGTDAQIDRFAASLTEHGVGARIVILGPSHFEVTAWPFI
jgi:hypothetical protein